MGFVQDIVSKPMRDEKGHFIKGHKTANPKMLGCWKKGQKPWCFGKTHKEDTRISIAPRRLGKRVLSAKHRTITKLGYVEIYEGDKTFRQLEHRFIMEQYLGRKLNSGEQIHHINGNRQDNSISNLQVINIHEHGRIHGLEGGRGHVHCI